MRKPTMKQQKALASLVANGGSLASAMRDAGYSSKTARDPRKFTQSPVVQPLIEDVLSAIRKRRDEAILKMDEAIDKASYGDLRQTVEGFTKLEQLLSGNATERSELIDTATMTPEERKEYLKNRLKS